jgi:protein-S-isoprenylcysteine O-methyltransferase Ste14
MTISAWVILALWISFIVYWAVSARGAKRTVGRRAWWREGALRLAIVGLVLLAVRIPAARHVLREARLPVGAFAGIAATLLCALGLGLAVWARVHLGRNWGLPMSRKEDPDLVTTGPYAAIRHPIYAGLLLAMLGSAIGRGLFWLLLLVAVGAYFVASARREEAFMLEQFPAAYAAYRARTKMLLPFAL